jgi:hypothetical protein
MQYKEPKPWPEFARNLFGGMVFGTAVLSFLQLFASVLIKDWDNWPSVIIAFVICWTFVAGWITILVVKDRHEVR